mgnify:CR=1 FL=1
MSDSRLQCDLARGFRLEFGAVWDYSSGWDRPRGLCPTWCWTLGFSATWRGTSVLNSARYGTIVRVGTGLAG